ncbi:MAG: hypothetical protein P8090_18935 [Gammaproteobacteria bacterium]
MAAAENWFEEKQSAWLYRQLAAREPDPHKQKLFKDLANAAERQALDWARTLGDAGQALPEFRPTLRARVSAWLVRRLGVRVMRPVLAAMKIRGRGTICYHSGRFGCELTSCSRVYFKAGFHCVISLLHC